jgi:hypothetical protein
VINTFHQVGSALGLSILVAIGAASVPAGASTRTALLDRVHTALTGSSVLLVLGLAIVLLFIARKASALPESPAASKRDEPIVGAAA